MIEGTGIQISDEEYIKPYHFADMNETQQCNFMRRLGLDSENQQFIKVKIKELMQCRAIPSPSAMKWENVKSILHGELPESASQPVPIDDITDSRVSEDFLQLIVALVQKKFRRQSEMEVVVRIFLLVLFVVADLESNIRVELQPSCHGHSAFTDFLIKVTTPLNQVRIIEVKRPDVGVDLLLELDTTAQALREAHILLCNDNQIESPMPFILTNGNVWSCGQAARHTLSKITLESVHTVFCDLSNISGWKSAMKHIKAYISGTWPPQPSC